MVPLRPLRFPLASVLLLALLMACSRTPYPPAFAALDAESARVRLALGASRPVWEIQLRVEDLAPLRVTARQLLSAEKLAQRGGDYRIELIGEAGGALAQIPFAPPRRTFCVLPPRAGDGRYPVSAPRDTVLVTVPQVSGAVAFRVRDAAGTVRSEGSLLGVPLDYHAPRFQALSGDTTPDHRLHLYYLGHGYSDQAQLDTDIQRFYSYLIRTYPVWASMANRIVVLKGQGSFDLGCGSDAQVSRVFECDDARVAAEANAAGIVYDAAVVLIKSSVYGGAAMVDSRYLTVTTDNEWSLQVEAHELGHLTGLGDEYTYEAGLDFPALVNLAAPLGGNCSMTNPASDPVYAALWNAASYFPGCEKDSWFRSSSASLMYDLTEEYNPISVGLMNQYFDGL